MLQTTDFKYSISWLNKFKARYGLTSKKAHGESGSVDKNVTEGERNRLKQVCKCYEKKKFIIDEIAKFW